MDELNWRATCFHEAAHAIVAERLHWTVLSVCGHDAYTNVRHPVPSHWTDHLDMAVYALVGEPSAYRAIGRPYAWPTLDHLACEDRDCGWENEVVCDNCAGTDAIAEASTEAVAFGLDPYQAVQQRIGLTLDNDWPAIAALAGQLMMEPTP